MYVIKRDNSRELVQFDKIYERINKLNEWDDLNIHTICINTILQMTDNITTETLDKLSADICASMTSHDFNYSLLGAKILMDRLYKNLEIKMNCKISFRKLTNMINDEINNYLNKDYVDYVNKYSDYLDKLYSDGINQLKYIDYFSFKTLEKGYLIRNHTTDVILETPNALLLRVAIAIHYPRLNESEEIANIYIKNTYDAFLKGEFIHATPTLFNAGTNHEQLSSCFLLGIDDSIEGIFKCLSDTAQISKWAGGIGIHISNIRSKSRLIKSSNGKSGGIIPMLQVFNSVGRYVNQCFVPDTLVFTFNGFKKIKNINTLDLVLTSDGTFKKVLKKIVNKVKDELLYSISNKYSFCEQKTLDCTGSHEILINNKYIPACHLKVGDKMSYCLPNKVSYYNPIIGITRKLYTGKLYDLHIEDNHNYTTHSGIVHNSGKRNGSIAIYLEPWHADILDFLEIKKPTGNENDKCRDLFIALWIPDNFMQAVESDSDWYLMSEDQCPLLTKTHGKEYEELYNKYVSEGKYIKKIKATVIWQKILISQMETGTPYIAYKDNINKKTNHSNLGTIRSSNLCVHGDTKILTRYGYIEISKLLNREVEIWNGFEWSNVIVRKTGTNKNLIRVYFSNNLYLDCTPEHKFYLKGYKEVIGKTLYVGDELIDFSYPIIEIDSYPYKYLNIKHNSTIKERELWIKDIINCNEIKILVKERAIELCNLLHGLGINSIIEESDPSYILRIYNNFKPIYVSKIEESYSNVDTYCFTEPIRNLGMFNGIVTGQCIEIMEYSDENEYAVCNLASIAINRFYNKKNNTYDYKRLSEITKLLTYNLNRIIDINYYPVKETYVSNKKNRPIGIGIQGYADLLAMCKLPFESDKSLELINRIMETIYYSAYTESNRLAIENGPYETFAGSPLSEGKFQFDFWNEEVADRYDWNKLRNDIIDYGVRNSLITALMPTASTSQILGNTESFEPITSNIYTRRVLAGDFMIINKYLVNDLKELGLWNNEMREELIKNYGSVQTLDIPKELKEIYKTVWEIKQKILINHALKRAPWVDQSQSMNLYFKKPTANALTSALFYGWKMGIKTGCYYLRSHSAVNAQQLSICSSCSA